MDIYDNNMFRFYSLKKFENIECYFSKHVEYDLDNIANTLDNFKTLYIFSEYLFDFYVYAIQLNGKNPKQNNIYAILNGQYKVVANSFTHFLELYLSDEQQLFI